MLSNFSSWQPCSEVDKSPGNASLIHGQVFQFLPFNSLSEKNLLHCSAMVKIIE